MNKPANSTPAAWKSGGLSYGSGLTLDIAKKMLEAGEKEAEKQGVPMSIAISDAGGNLIAFRRMNDAALFSIQIAMDKAFTAVSSKWSTKTCGEVINGGGFIPLFLHERWITFPGGYPIISDGIIVGGVGVSGGTFEDIYVARAMLQTGGFDTKEADATLAQIESGEKG